MELAFILKKVISAFLMPLSLGLALGFIGLWFLYKENLKKAKTLLISIVKKVPLHVEAIGLDNSEAMLNQARKKCDAYGVKVRL